MNQSPDLIDRVVLCPWGSGVARRLWRHPSPQSQPQPRELAAPSAEGTRLKTTTEPCGGEPLVKFQESFFQIESI